MSSPARRILVLFAHPALEKSRANRLLVLGVDRMEGVTFHDLYEEYPNLDIDVAREQQLLGEHDVVVMHHPFYWYSTPAILKEWQDLVLQHGWAYGKEGKALHGKLMFNVLTAGGPEDAYRSDGFHGYTVRQLLVPLARTAWLCGMKYLAPFVAHGTLRMEEAEIATHAEEYQRLLAALRDDRFDVEAAAAPDLPFVNGHLDRLIREEV